MEWNGMEWMGVNIGELGGAWWGQGGAGEGVVAVNGEGDHPERHEREPWASRGDRGGMGCVGIREQT